MDDLFDKIGEKLINRAFLWFIIQNTEVMKIFCLLEGCNIEKKQKSESRYVTSAKVHKRID